MAKLRERALRTLSGDVKFIHLSRHTLKLEQILHWLRNGEIRTWTDDDKLVLIEQLTTRLNNLENPNNADNYL